MNPPINQSPIKNKNNPIRNCNHKNGIGLCRIPNTISPISLTPSAAKNPGINKRIRAKILFIGSSFQKLIIQKILKQRKNLSRRRIQITIE